MCTVGVLHCYSRMSTNRGLQQANSKNEDPSGCILATIQRYSNVAERATVLITFSRTLQSHIFNIYNFNSYILTSFLFMHYSKKKKSRRSVFLMFSFLSTGAVV